MSILQRLVSPDLTASLKQTELERDFYKARHEEDRDEIKALKLQLKADREVNTVTVQHLISQICQVSGGKPIPPAKASDEEKTAEGDEPEDLSAEQEDILRQRAREICEQKIFERAVTDTDVDAQYQQMLKAPHHWLVD